MQLHNTGLSAGAEGGGSGGGGWGGLGGQKASEEGQRVRRSVGRNIPGETALMEN